MNSQLSCFIPVSAHSDFTIHNLPYGIFSRCKEGERRVGVAIGEWILDLAALEQAGILRLSEHECYFNQPSLNKFIESGSSNWQKVRRELQVLLALDNPRLQHDVELQQQVLYKQQDAIMHLPVQISGYTDFYSSKEHATNVGCMFRDPKNALLPNWSELPVGYNGRASSVVVSGTEIVRPSGQIKLPEQERPVFSATRKLDFELETAFIVGKPSRLGQPIHIEDAEAHIFGMVLLNDWSARDIQQWEYVPLGPFNSKTFASAISPWVVTMQALQPFKVQGPVQEPRPLAYLQESVESSYDIQLSVEIQTPQNDSADVICQTNFKYMYWSMAQQLTHHTIAGCNVNVGDLMGSGTISGTTKDSYGSLLELTWNSTAPLTLANSEQRSFVQDGDTVIMKGHAEKEGIRVGFGEVRNTILPALSFDFAETVQVQHETV
ncbi:fumarylacetoacetase [Acinetobacter sp. ANC 4178]|uniref:fumarylacetoacetase n=1 Tax=Acinetobacter sp. ANC 4178 TaxID=2529839 RepID=UPI00104055F5|nr:fumarylacetoacetase [Acinetobacter sp. ANC 4178]TCB67534.1 fumarylacetoacetase [Acinetobacter sp. ANC 4178]